MIVEQGIPGIFVVVVWVIAGLIVFVVVIVVVVSAPSVTEGMTLRAQQYLTNGAEIQK